MRVGFIRIIGQVPTIVLEQARKQHKSRITGEFVRAVRARVETSKSYLEVLRP